MSPSQNMPPVPMENMVPMDPYMSPLDLYDSIWWGKYTWRFILDHPVWLLITIHRDAGAVEQRVRRVEL